ncbi:hypothetical protein [Rugamonas sp. DEMB1]|uniref:hypothetical protein n=1 Tax=Rugamonas sp. DEMB1 TaxID=3039386 RepID=UPI0024497CCA|nr:hypothetical protein [Rugamonas sp. DEMB1]WGG49989.1 hypothetical protein QC826_26565 [Rugamonas sp. DEMB1]
MASTSLAGTSRLCTLPSLSMSAQLSLSRSGVKRAGGRGVLLMMPTWRPIS